MSLRSAGQVSNYEHQKFLGAIKTYGLTREARPLFKACGRMWNYTDKMASCDCVDVQHITGKTFFGSYGDAARAVRRSLVALDGAASSHVSGQYRERQPGHAETQSPSRG